MNDIVNIDYSDYGLEENKAKQIQDFFTPMLDKMVELEKEYNAVIDLDRTEITCLIAKELRQKYVKVRTGTAKIHKELKSFYLKGGRFVDGWKNAQVMASENMEKNLLEIEKHYENIENEKKKKIEEERWSLLQKYGAESISLNLGEMQEEVWCAYFESVKRDYELKLEAEKKIETERIEKEKAEKEEAERIRKENETLKKQAEEKEKAYKIELEAKEKEERIRVEKEEIERRATQEEQRIKDEKQKLQEEVLRQNMQREAKEKERFKQIILTNARIEKEEEEQRIKAEEIELQKELSKSETEKFNDFITDLESVKEKYDFNSIPNRNKYKVFCEVIGLMKHDSN